MGLDLNFRPPQEELLVLLPLVRLSVFLEPDLLSHAAGASLLHVETKFFFPPDKWYIKSLCPGARPLRNLSALLNFSNLLAWEASLLV